MSHWWDGQGLEGLGFGSSCSFSQLWSLGTCCAWAPVLHVLIIQSLPRLCCSGLCALLVNICCILVFILDEFLEHGLLKDTTMAPWFLLLPGSIGEYWVSFLCPEQWLKCQQSLVGAALPMSREIPLGLR